MNPSIRQRLLWTLLSATLVVWVGTAIIIENCIEVAVFDSPPWRAVAHVIYGALT